jgi:phenylpropionate dioxygenase-like ring-hydroxylating dioxygenase large terminal subunit
MPPLAYPCSWYPLARSTDLRRGQVMGVTALGRRLALFRTAGGTVAALEAACAHLGADLSRGTVCGERLRCPLHHWEYSTAGCCEAIPHQAHIPPRAVQAAFVCIERYGMIFAFLGGAPTFAFPPPLRPAHTAGDAAGQRHSRPSISEIQAAAPVLVANSFDGQHFATVHHRALIAPLETTSHAPEHLAVRYQARVAGLRFNDRLLRLAGINTVDVTIHCWGGNLIQVDNRRTRNTILVAILPVDETRSRVFITTLMARHNGWLTGPAQWLYLHVAHWLTLAFLKPDLAVLEGFTLRPRTLLPDADATLIRWLRYWRALPRPAGNDERNREDWLQQGIG